MIDFDDQDAVSGLGRKLASSWEATAADFRLKRRSTRTTTPQFAVTHALCAHVHRLLLPALDLLDQGLVIEALPLVREAYESGLTAQWVAQTRTGAEAFVNEEVRQRRNLVRSLEEATSEVFRDAAESVAAQEIEALPSNASAKRFDEVCDDLKPRGKDAYVLYRVMSQLCHPSVLVVDRYLEQSDSAVGVTLRLDPDQPSAATWTHVLVSAAVWAGRAVDYFDKTNRRRSELRAAARDLGIRTDLQLSDSAWLAEK